MAITFHGATYAGVSGDTKPSSNLSAGDLFVETNTDKIFQWNGSAWDAVTVADTSITLAKMAINSIDSDQYVDGSIDLAHMSSQSVDEDNLYISNAGSNGEFLSKQSGNNGGLTWAAAGGAALTGSTNNTVTTVTGANAITGEANLTFDGTNLTVGTGNVVIGTAGKGIDFSAQTGISTAGTPVSELLDHYEEGTWEPEIWDNTSGGNQAGYLRQYGSYVRIGRTVFCNFEVALNSISGMSTNYTTILRGLPFTATNTPSSLHYPIHIGAASGMSITAGQSVSGIVGAGMAAAYMYVWGNTAGHLSLEVGDLAADGLLRGSMIYLV